MPRQIKREPSEILGQSRCCVPTTPAGESRPLCGSRREARRHCAMREKAPPSRLASQKTCQILSCSSCRGRHAFHAVIRSAGAEGASGEACRRENRCGPRGLGRCRGRAAGAVVRLSRLRARRTLFPFLSLPTSPLCSCVALRASPPGAGEGASWATFLYNYIKR